MPPVVCGLYWRDVQHVKRHLHDRSPKTVNNVLVVLSVRLKKLEWRDPTSADIGDPSD